MSSSPRIDNLGQLKAAIARGEIRRRPVRDEVRDNLSERLKRKDTLFPGIIGYDETVIPQLVNAVLARHHFILLGLERPGEDAHPARAHDAARRVAAGDSGQ